MHSSPKGQQAAEYARRVAQSIGKPEHNDLSSKMCWDAVLLCLSKSGAMSDGEVSAMKPSSDQWANFIRAQDPVVGSADAARRVPQGAILGFVDPGSGKLIHAMLSVGAGMAAGNKNSCIGLGKAVGWELLDLSRLQWQIGSDSFKADGKRTLKLYQRPI